MAIDPNKGLEEANKAVQGFGPKVVKFLLPWGLVGIAGVVGLAFLIHALVG